MDFDPDFEFDAPRWFDFTKDDGEFSFSDSWFENDHPLHEPKVPQHKTSGKPILNKDESKPGPSRKVHTKSGQTNKVKGKKSLGIKTIRTKRGEHGPKTCSEQKEKSRGVREIPSVRTDSGEQSPGGEVRTEDERATAGKFRCDPNFVFSPPWSTSPSITGNSSESVHQSLEDNINKQEVTSQIKDNSTQQVQSEPPFIRPAVSTSSVGSSSMRSLLTKAVNRAAQKRPPGGTKRRLLPTIPPQKKKPEINVSHGRAATTKAHKTQPASDVRKPGQSSAPLDSNTVIPLHVCPSETSAAVPNEDTCTIYNTTTKPSVSGQSDDLDTSPSGLQQSDNLSYPSRLSTLEHGPGGISESSSFRDIDPGTKQPSPSPEEGEMSIEEMLKMHNRKILATKCKYDDNGRKIRSATPTFCPAPDKGTKTAKRAKRKSATMSQQPSGNASSIAAAPSKKLAHCSEGVSSLTTSKQEKDAGVPNTAPTQSLLNGSASTAVAKDNRAACPGNGESQAQTAKRQKKQASMAKFSCPDTSSKHVVTGQKRAGSSAEVARASAKQKRRSCMPSIGVNANTGVLQPSSGTHQNQKGVGKCPSKQKRRSCIAGIQKSSVSHAEKELEELIQRHNSQIVAKKS